MVSQHEENTESGWSLACFFASQRRHHHVRGVQGVNEVGREGAALLGRVRGRAGALHDADLLQHCPNRLIVLRITALASALAGRGFRVQGIGPALTLFGGRSVQLGTGVCLLLHASPCPT